MRLLENFCGATAGGKGKPKPPEINPNPLCLVAQAACLPAALANYPRAPPKDAGAVEMDPL